MELTRKIRDKRVAIARDVIAQIGLKEGGLQMTRGRYLSGGLEEETTLGLDYDGDLREYADLVQANCEVCQLGALMISKARLYDGAPIADFVDGDEIWCGRSRIVELMSDIFDGEALYLLECAFETAPGEPISAALGSQPYLAKGSQPYLAKVFGQRYPKSSGRAIGIMQKLIDHDGEFVPAMEASNASA